MTPEEIQAMAKGLAEGQAVWYLGSAVIGGAITGLAAYFAEKGKNRATKEDIGEITRTVKAVEAGFNEKLADLQAHHQLRMVAAERRMQAHQEAFELWVRLYNAAVAENRGDIQSLALTCAHWYSKNCIYLTNASRSAFNTARVSAVAHFSIKDDVEAAARLLLPNWEKLEAAGNVFLIEVSLPTMNPESLGHLRP